MENKELILPGKEEIPTQLMPFNNNFNLQKLLETAGTLDLTEEQMKIINEPVNPEEILIRPDGLIYLPWHKYHKQLTRLFGTRWSLIPNGMPQYEASRNEIIWGFYLIVGTKDENGNIRQHYVGFAIGGNEYQPQNPTMSYNDAIEGAKSNALMRLCKELGMFLELWDKDFVEKWKNQYAEHYIDSKGKLRWRKKTKQEIEKNIIEVEAIPISTKYATEKQKQELRNLAQHPAFSKNDKETILKILNAKIDLGKYEKVKQRINEKISQYKEQENKLRDELFNLISQSNNSDKAKLLKKIDLDAFAEEPEIIEQINNYEKVELERILKEIKGEQNE